MNKLVTAQEAIKDIHDGASIMIGGFMSNGTPEILVDALLEKGVKDLTIIGNDAGLRETGIGKLILNRRVKKLVASHIGLNPEAGKQMTEGTMDIDLVPQGTLAEQIRAGGAGLGGVLTQTGLGTIVQEGKEIIEIKGESFLLELPMRADFALIRGSVADKKGNIVYNQSTRNFNTLMATAADTVIVGAEKIVEVGEIDPNHVMTPHIFVDYIVGGEV